MTVRINRMFKRRVEKAAARAFRLGTEIDQSGATAKCAEGVLELTLPKKTAAAGRQLTIQ